VNLRDWLNNNPKIVTGATIGMILIVVYLIFTSSGGGLGGAPAPVRDMAFFSDDDGASWFADDGKKIPPFDRNGKQAVRARVYRAGGKTYVNHLERYTPEAKKKLEAILARSTGSADVLLPDTAGMEVKAPGGGAWVGATRPEAAKIMAPRIKAGDLEIVVP
jgi:hypothetical protein